MLEVNCTSAYCQAASNCCCTSGCLSRFALRFQALGQTEQRPAIVGVLPQVFSIDRFRFTQPDLASSKAAPRL